MSIERTVGRDTAPYRQGMVLGLTMAEIMLLLVFCVLIALAAFIAHERDNTSEARAEVSEARVLLEKSEERLRISERGVERLQQQQVIPDNWDSLVEADAALQRLEEAGISVEQALRMAPIADAVEEAIGPTSPTELAQLLKAALAAREQDASGEHDWPPIISLREAEGYYFNSGSAELSERFRGQITGEVVPILRRLIKQYKVDIIEVIGHTDEQRIAQRFSNMDDSLADVMQGRSDVAVLVPADNTGLGMARAVSMTNALKADPRLAEMTILPLSGGQLIDNGDHLTDWSKGGDVRERRRIDIRLRRSSGEISTAQ